MCPDPRVAVSTGKVGSPEYSQYHRVISVISLILRVEKGFNGREVEEFDDVFYLPVVASSWVLVQKDGVPGVGEGRTLGDQMEEGLVRRVAERAATR